MYSVLDKSKIFLEAVLLTHDNSVTGLCWTTVTGKLRLVSCSLDCTVCLWACEEEGGWSVETRLGQFIGNKNAYFDVLCDPKQTCLFALNYTGAVLSWHWNGEKFDLQPCFTGHANYATGIEWNHTGDFLVTVSKDQTTRVITRNKATGKFG